MKTEIISDELQIAVDSHGRLLLYLTGRDITPLPSGPFYSPVSSAPFRRDSEYQFTIEQTEAIRDFLNECLPKKNKFAATS